MKHPNGKIVIAGGSGFLGRTLIKHFVKQGYELVVLSRSEGSLKGATTAKWDGITLGDWAGELEGAIALINLAGRSVNCRYNARNRREIMDSRVLSTRILGEAIQRCQIPPKVWINSSTATIYKHRFDAANDEEEGWMGAHPDAKDAFAIEVALAWEKVCGEAVTPKTRKLVIRTAMIFGNEKDGVYEVLRRLVRLGLGGKMGSGQQFVSWLHEEDFCRAIEWLIAHEDKSGIYNLCSPGPITNQDMMRIMRDAIGVPIGLPANRLMLELGAFVLRTETELMIKSRRVVPKKLLDEGYEFRYPKFDRAVRELEQRERK